MDFNVISTGDLNFKTFSCHFIYISFQNFYFFVKKMWKETLTWGGELIFLISLTLGDVCPESSFFLQILVQFSDEICWFLVCDVYLDVKTFFSFYLHFLTGLPPVAVGKWENCFSVAYYPTDKCIKLNRKCLKQTSSSSTEW